MDCLIREDLCPIYRGDTPIYDVKLTYSDGSPVDISGMTLIFSAKLNKDSEDGVVGDFKVTTLFEVGDDSSNGIGSITIPSKVTMTLVPSRNMHYDVKLIGGGIVSTVAAGMFQVVQTIPKKIP
jgi:hypothetical protein